VTTLPVYLVVDTSASLMGEIDSINAGLVNLFESLEREPAVVDIIRVALIQFSTDARVVMPLTNIGHITMIPSLEAEGTTNYTAALRLVRQLIPKDIAELRAAGLEILRPLMFFVTDGSPTDPDWQVALEDLISPEFRAHPTIVAIGFGSADPNILRAIGGGNGRAFMISDAVSIRDSVGSIWPTLTSMLTATAISSARSPGDVSPVHIPAQWLDVNSLLILSAASEGVDEHELRVLQSLYRYGQRVPISADPTSDFHESKLRGLRNRGLIATDAGHSFRRSTHVQITELGRMVIEDRESSSNDQAPC
jgi:uncharacterized protein YegL